MSGEITFDRLRDLYGMATRWESNPDDPRLQKLRESNLAEFDATMARHDAEVAARALREAANEIGHAEGCRSDPDRDPYIGCMCTTSLYYARADRIEAG